MNECDWYTSSQDGICNSLGSIEEIDLRGNNLVGRLPDELLLLSETLVSIRVDDNTIREMPFNSNSGGLMEQFQSLTRLHAQGNPLGGSVPTEFGAMTRLTSLNLARSQIVGRIPSEFGRLIRMQQLDLNTNSMSGSIPSEIGQMTSMGKFGHSRECLIAPRSCFFASLVHSSS
jgi:Leucine-rich repeat (LRR) protein